MVFLYFYRTNIQHGLSRRFTNKKSMVGIFVLSLLAMMLAMMIVPLCYSSTLIDRHHPDGRKFRIEINDERTRNSTLTLTGGKPAGNADFPVVGNGGFFYLPPPPWGGGGGRPSGLFEIDLTLLQPVINWLMSIGKGSGDGRQAANEDGQPSGGRINAGSNGATNHQAKRDAPEDQENQSPGEGNDGSGDGNNRKDDNGEQSKNNASTQDLQVIANELLAIIESDDPNAVFEFRERLDKLNLRQRLHVLETKGTNIRATVTPLEAILALPRSSHEQSARNRFIQHLIESAGDDYLMIYDDNKLLMISYKIVQDIIHKVNESHQQPPIGDFEKRCFTEYLTQVFLINSNPVEPIRNLLEEISDLAIRNEVVNDAQSLIFPDSFVDVLAQSDHKPSFHELMRLSDEVRIQAQYSASQNIDNYFAINALSDHALSDHALHVDKAEPTHIIAAECTICQEQFVHTSNIVKTPCGHLYHVDCLNRWFKKRELDRETRNCPTCRTELNAFSKKLNDFDKLLRKYSGFHSLAIAKRAVNEWNKAETSYETLYHFVQFCRHSSLPSDDSKFVKLLQQILHPVIKAKIRHDDVIKSATFSANNHLMVTASRNGTAKIYVYQSDGSWKVEFTIRHGGPVKFVSFSADSRRVLTASDDGTAKIHVQMEDGSWEKEHTIQHSGPIHSATFSTDNRRVLTASKDGTAKIHVQKEVGSWEEEGIISHDGPIDLARFSDDGNHVVTVSEDNVVKITSQSADRSWQVKIIVIHRDDVNSAIFSHDNRYVVTASDDGTAKVIARKGDESWEEEFTISHITDSSVISAAISSDSRHVLTVGDDNLVKIIGKQANGSWVVKAIISHSDEINTATFSPDSRHVVTAGKDHQAKIYGEKTHVSWEEEITIHYNSSVSSATFSPDSQHAVTVTTSHDGTANIHSLKHDGSWEKGLTMHHTDKVTSATFSANGRFVMTFGLDGAAKIAQLKGDGSWEKKIIIRQPSPIFSASFSANSRFVLIQSFLGRQGVFDNIVSITELWKE
ncbi:RING finger domain-containing protein [Endozoicomonas sp. 4G]|uniref:RING finger domain-containing protein n=1 Tax=Endozoicomonas sp. 4G TaxID=2872754 RepID=UPI00207912DC|nr:RING finger domain-containing protein [Endozoicomonas sp. 4G]